MDIYTTSQARANLFKIIDYVAASHDPVHIVGKNNKAVLISEEDYTSLIETLYITSIPGLKESIIRESKEPITSFSDTINLDDDV